MSKLLYLQVIFVISVEIFLIAQGESIRTSFCPKVGLLNIFSQAYTVLVGGYAPFFGIKYPDLQLHVTNYKNKQLFYLQS